MGFPADSHIRKFVRGKVLSDILPGDGGSFVLMFEDGEMLRLQAFAKQPVRPQVEIVATPIRADGDVKQIGDIMQTKGFRI